MTRVYVSGPIRGAVGVEKAFARGTKLALDAGARLVVCPSLDGTLIPGLALDAKSEEAESIRRPLWLAADIARLAQCDTILMLPGWRDSRGARAEHAYALATGVRVVHVVVEGGAS
jgi:hypothetical protein